MSERLSVAITTLNNAATLGKCLSSVAFADEIVVVDSGSSDATLELCAAAGARVIHQAFLGYGPQKRIAIQACKNRLVLLLDADEWLPSDCQQAIAAALESPGDAAGFTLPRREQVFWRYQHRRLRMNRYLRIVDRNRFSMSAGIHAAPEVAGPVRAIGAFFVHDGEPDIATKVAKINAYSSALANEKVARGARGARWKMLAYPAFVFLRQYLFKRHFLDGWAGFIASATMAYYAFLKYAKLYEARQR